MAQPTESIATIVANSDVHNTLEAAIGAAGLTATLDGTDDLTLFAPTDAAFDALPANLVNALLTDPTGVLTDVLLYHVLAGENLSTSLSDGQEVTTLFDEQISTISIVDGDVFINNAQITTVDVLATNGVVHIIDAVLIPETTTVFDVVAESDVHNTLEAALSAAGLEETLSNSGSFTLFAPTDAAFEALPEGVVELLLTDPTGVLSEVLLYHAVNSIALSTDLSDGQVVTTINGQDVTIGVAGSTVTVNGAEVVIADIPTTNGVVHVIDAVLVPATTTVYDVVVNSDDHTILESAINLAGLDELLSSTGTYTLFAPTDAAFNNLEAGVLESLTDDPQGLLTQVLTYHVLGSIEISSNLVDGPVATVFVETVDILVSGGSVMVNDATVTAADIATINGVVHVIDAVLVPTTLSVNDIKELKTLEIYPNPVVDQLSVNLELVESARVSIDIVDLTGRVVKSFDYGKRSAGVQREVLNLQDISKGIYLMNLNIGKNQVGRKIQVQ